MKNLFDKDCYTEISQRMNALTADSERQWGKMGLGQMLAHCKIAFSVPLSEKKMPRNVLGLLIGWMFKNKLHNDEPWKKNLPTAPNFIIKGQREFEKERAELMSLVDRFYYGGPEKAGRFPHPMFGPFTKEQWGKAMYKHLDHHLRQFGA